MKVTYVLGAGASFQAVPVYKDFMKHITDYVNFIKSFVQSHDNTSKTENPAFRHIAKRINTDCTYLLSVLEEMTYFGTADTLAVAHKKEADRLTQIKRLLSSYIYSQHFKVTNEILELVYDDIPGKSHYPQYGNNLDRRYISFWSSILSHYEANELPENLSFVCWNYDFQIQIALSKFIDDDALVNKFVSEKIVSLNGCARINHNLSLKRTEMDQEIFIRSLKHLYASETETIKFSWEKGGDEIIKNAFNLIKQADQVIFIGYSFPDYNRKVDLELLNAAKNKQIIIQSPDAEKLHIKLTEIDKKIGGNTKVVTDVDGFYIPAGIWGKIQYSMQELGISF